MIRESARSANPFGVARQRRRQVTIGRRVGPDREPENRLHGRTSARNGDEPLRGKDYTRSASTNVRQSRQGKSGTPFRILGMAEPKCPGLGGWRVRIRREAHACPAAGLSRQRLRTGLGGRIRTCDPGHPKPVLYQAELRPDAARSIHEPVASGPIRCSRSVLHIARPDEVCCASARASCRSTMHSGRHDLIPHAHPRTLPRHHPGL